MKKWLLIFVLPLLFAACKSKPKQLTEEDGLTAPDFIARFRDVKLPYLLNEDSLEKKKQDTAAISFKTFTQLVPDTLLEKPFGKTGRPRFYPMGKIVVKKQETYLFVKAISAAEKAAYVLVFDKEKKFVTGLPLLLQDNNAASNQTALVDNKYSITTNTQRKTADGKLIYKKAAWAFISSAGGFALILTESNESDTKKELLNPIDTLAGKNKLAGDYRQNRLNIVSVRDSKKPGFLFFFIHFEKDNGGCRGELKGEAKIVSPGKAVYRQSGDQCVLELQFKGNKVTLKEDGCGSHRDIKCFFEGSFIRKTPPKAPAKGSKAVKPK